MHKLLLPVVAFTLTGFIVTGCNDGQESKDAGTSPQTSDQPNTSTPSNATQSDAKTDKAILRAKIASLRAVRKEKRAALKGAREIVSPMRARLKELKQEIETATSANDESKVAELKEARKALRAEMKAPLEQLKSAREAFNKTQKVIKEKQAELTN